MGDRVGVWLACLAGLALAACGGGPVREAVPEASGPSPVDMPPPSAMHGPSYALQDLFKWGSEYSDALPHDNVARAGLDCAFLPNWVKPGGRLEGTAYATYEFQLTGFNLDPSVRFSWTHVGDFSNGWVGVADFPHNCWNWYPLPAGGVLPFEPAKHISDSGAMKVVVMVTGTAWWRLQQLRIGVDAARGDWWMPGHDPQHTRRSPFVGAQTPTVKWVFTMGYPVRTSPAIGADGTLYVGYVGGPKLYAINPDGKPKWGSPAAYQGSNPAIGADGRVFMAGGDWLFAFDPDGTLRWKYLTAGGVSEPTIAVDGTLYVTSGDGYLYAIKPNRKVEWTSYAFPRSSPAVAPDGTIYVGGIFQNLCALRPDGSLKWTFPEGSIGNPSWLAIGSDGTVYQAGGDGYLYAIKPDGTLKWKFLTGDRVDSSPAVGTDGTVYVGSTDHNLYAINSDGTLKWNYPTGDWVTSSPAIGADGTVYVGSWDDKVYAINSDGTLKWSYLTGGEIWSSPVIGANGTVYVGSDDGNLYAFADP